MKQYIPQHVKRLFRFCKNMFFSGFYEKSYSQEGEDMILRRIFEYQDTGFFIDVGAHHPKRFSNTFYFYKKGWNGINIDANPGGMKLFHLFRRRDINLEVAIGDTIDEQKYYVFSDTALNTFSKQLQAQYVSSGNTIEKVLSISTVSLNKLLKTHASLGKKIDFLSIDVEGSDYAVIQSLDFSVYAPTVILIELLEKNIKKIFEDEVYVFLIEKGYSLYAKTVNTAIFLKNNEI